ncbi:MAG: hypothetical protein WDN28_21070 [Chthoniobacter sp.]
MAGIAGSDLVAAGIGSNLVISLQTNSSNPGAQHNTILATFDGTRTAGSADVQKRSAMAALYASVLVNRGSSVQVDAALAAAIKQVPSTTVSVADLTNAAINLAHGF